MNHQACLTGQKIDGITVANSVKDRVRIAAAELRKENIEPCLVTVIVADKIDAPFLLFVNKKAKPPSSK